MAPCDILKQALRAAGATSVTVSLNQFGDLKKKANQTKTTRHRKRTNGTKSKQKRQSENYHYTTTLMM